MRQGEVMQPGSGHFAPGPGQQIFVSVRLETYWVKDLDEQIKGMRRLCVHEGVCKYAYL